jgi:hypothetical protein
MCIVKKKGIQSLLRKPEQEEPLWRFGRIILCVCLKETKWEVWMVFVRLIIRVSAGFVFIS